MGSCAAIASLYALTITLEPSIPSAPLFTVASEAKTITLLPATLPVAATMPHLLFSVKSWQVPESSNLSIRCTGSRGSSPSSGSTSVAFMLRE